MFPCLALRKYQKHNLNLIVWSDIRKLWQCLRGCDLNKDPLDISGRCLSPFFIPNLDNCGKKK